MRLTLTDALISYQGEGYKEKEWKKVYDQLSELVWGLEKGLAGKDSSIDNQNLSQNFVNAMKNAAKEGIRNE